MLNFLSVCEVPFNKLKSSDENNFVPLLPVFFNSLCPLMRLDGQNSQIDYERICASVGELIITFSKSEINITGDDTSLENKDEPL